MSDKTASVHWEGRGKLGVGKISTQSGSLKSYSIHEYQSDQPSTTATPAAVR